MTRQVGFLFVIIFLGLFGYAYIDSNDKVSIRYVEPTNGYSQMTVSEQDGLTVVHISGQIGEGQDLEAQMRSALSQIERLLASEGMNYTNLVKINTYIVDYKESDLDVFRGVRKEIFGDEITPASTLVGVTSLAKEEWLIEIDAVAMK